MRVKIQGAVVGTKGITLYLTDGKKMMLSPQNHMVYKIMDEITGPLARREEVEIDLAKYSSYSAIEEKSGGSIRFHNRAITDFAEEIGLKLKDASRYASGYAAKVPLEEFGIQSGRTVVAFVNGKKIPGMENLRRHIDRAAYGEGFEGFERFMSRIADVADERGHTVQELLNFMKRCDIPIANDGSIIGYKTLNIMRTPHGEKGSVFVDIHTGKVKQRVGSRVSMPVDAVDESRRTQCSTGLHIARRGYLSGYMGDVVTLVKIAPEDVVAVPMGEPDKMRCAAYHIVSLLSQEAKSLLCSGKSITEDEPSAKVLADVINGVHIGVIEEVEIGGPLGSNVKVAETGASNDFLGAGKNGMAAAIDIDGKGDSINIKKISGDVENVISQEKSKKTITTSSSPNAHSKEMTDVQKKAFEGIKSGLSKALVAREAGVSPRTLGRWMDKFGVKIPDVSKEVKAIREETGIISTADSAYQPGMIADKIPSGVDLLEANKQHAVDAVKNGMSQREAERRFGVSRKVIARIIKRGNS